jgi:hypothetical protein
VSETDGQSIESPTGSAKAEASNGNLHSSNHQLRSIALVFEDFIWMRLAAFRRHE